MANLHDIPLQIKPATCCVVRRSNHQTQRMAQNLQKHKIDKLQNLLQKSIEPIKVVNEGGLLQVVAAYQGEEVTISHDDEDIRMLCSALWGIFAFDDDFLRKWMANLCGESQAEQKRCD